ncbi:Delta(1)-pyrroline-2-carboxylate reductase [Carnimonas sp. R-84981]|uniref:cyclodeaminase n=1 Tax=Carnimonas bestiolae TaxID=3402172 RepID=UPI003EDBF2B8
MQLYHRSAIANAVSLDHAALEAVEEGFAALGRGNVIQPPILSLEIAASNGEVDIKTACIKGAASFAIKISSGFFDNPAKGLPSGNGLMLVLSTETGEVEAILADEGYLTEIRTALAGAIASRCLARSDSHRVTLIGAGRQAELQLEALRLVRPIDQVAIWARAYDKAQHFAHHLSKRFGIQAKAHEDIATACVDADVIVTATPSRQPLLYRDFLPRGVHVTAMGSDSSFKKELDADVLHHADCVVIDSLSQSTSSGELRGITQPRLQHPPIELGSIVNGSETGRHAAADITVCDLTGTGVQDTAIALFALKRLSHSPLDSPVL